MWAIGVGIDRQGDRRADEWQAQVFGHGSARHLDLVDDEGIDALVANRGRSVPEKHLRLPFDCAKSTPQGGEALEFSKFLIARAERTGGKVFLADLAEPQSRCPDWPLDVGDLEVDHFMPPRLEPPPQSRQRIEVPRRGKTQDADTTPGSFVPGAPCVCAICLGTFRLVDCFLPKDLSSLLCHDVALSLWLPPGIATAK
jgi:hypothetical protein